MLLIYMMPARNVRSNGGGFQVVRYNLGKLMQDRFGRIEVCLIGENRKVQHCFLQTTRSIKQELKSKLC